MDSLNYIVTAKHYATREGAGNVRERILRHGQKARIIILGIDKPAGEAVKAEIDFGRWIAKCECGGAEMVDPDEPVFFCWSCGNRRNSGHVRPVVFPDVETRQEIERLVLERPVNDEQGLHEEDRAHRAIPIVKTDDGRVLSRSWKPEETIDDLKEQNKEIGKWHTRHTQP